MSASVYPIAEDIWVRAKPDSLQPQDTTAESPVESQQDAPLLVPVGGDVAVATFS